MLRRLQRGLETLYRLEPKAAVTNFVIDRSERDRAGVARSPREQLLLQEDPDGLAIGVYFDPELLESVGNLDVGALWSEGKTEDFLMLLEGVSHFVCVADRAEREQSVSALELELQAEVDKFVTLLLSLGPADVCTKRLRDRLYVDIEFDRDLDHEEQDRYRVANNNALRYATSLDERYISKGRIVDMLSELRGFYREGVQGKLDLIRRAA